MKILCFVFLLIASSLAFGSDWSFEVDGVNFEIGADGEIERIWAKHTEPVNFPDRRGISTATTIAEERAKARIIRFIQESVSDETTVYEYEAEAQIARARSQSRGQDTSSSPEIEREAVRASLRSIERMTRSAAEGQLRGVVRLEQDYNAEEESVYVVVGISRTTISASQGIRGFLDGTSSAAAEVDSEEQGTLIQHSERKSIGKRDW